MGKKGLTDEDVAMIASVAAEKAIEAYRKKEDSERKSGNVLKANRQRQRSC